MTDARLLATNPENSSLVPVACNASGQLIVSDVNIEAIPNDVTVDGDLDVTGSTSLDTLDAKGRARFGEDFKVEIRPFNGENASQLWVEDPEGLPTFTVNGNGSAIFSGGAAGFTSTGNLFCTTAVSYTHLTLPTKVEV